MLSPELVCSSGQTVTPSHLLLNVLDIHLSRAQSESDKWIDEKDLMAATRSATRELLMRSLPVAVGFDWVEDDFYYSPEIDEEILTMESVGLVREKKGCRLLSFTERAEGLRAHGELVAEANSNLSQEVIAVVREAIETCLRR
jgi:hypothetical protein